VASETEISGMWRIVAAVAGGGITAAIILLVLTCPRVKRGTGENSVEFQSL